MINHLFLMTFVALVAGSLPLWYRAIQRSMSNSSLITPRERIASPFGLVDVATLFVIWIFGQLASTVVAAFLLGFKTEELDSLASDERAWFVILIGIGQLVSTLAAMTFVLARYRFWRAMTADDRAVGQSYGGVGWEIFGLQKHNFLRDVGIGLLAFPMVIPGVLVIQWLLTLLVSYEHSTLEMLTDDKSGLTILSTWLVAGVVAPICEEIFFRGVLQSWFQRLGEKGFLRSDETITGGWESTAENRDLPSYLDAQPTADTQAEQLPINPYQSPLEDSSQQRLDKRLAMPRYTPDKLVQWAPIVGSSSLFALAHAGQGLAPIPLFVLGLALGYLYRQTGSVVPCIVLHMGLNMFTLFWFTLKMLSG